MRDGFVIADADCHHMEPDTIWVDYVEPGFRDAAPRMGPIDGRHEMFVEGETLRETRGRYAFTPAYHEILERASRRFARPRAAGFDVASRLADMDEVGIDLQILNPTVGGQILGREYADPELLAACCRAYNDWSAEYCAAAPERLLWVAMLPIQEPSLAVEEIQRTAQKGASAFYLRPNPVKGRNLFHEDYWPVFAAAEAAGRPVSIHDTGSPRLPSYADRMATHTTGHIIAHPFETMATLMGLIWYGIAERFPALRIVHVEGDAGWIPYWLQRMEQHWDFTGNAEHPYLTMRPTEYFRRNFFVAARGDESTLPSVVDQVGDDNLLFNTDYPHSDGSYPWGVQSMLEQPLSDQSKRKLFWENTRRAFGLPDPGQRPLR